ncbi:hypothetical protein IO90_05970 [Chryseobacterium sp. FH1]|nr:hypothetical protein IO90_05970 [Chryseobacterium sp. FH1]
MTQWLKKEALLKFLGSQPSKTEEKHLLPKPEISLRFIWLFFGNQFCNFVFVMFCLSLISDYKFQPNGVLFPRQRLDTDWTGFLSFLWKTVIFQT